MSEQRSEPDPSVSKAHAPPTHLTTTTAPMSVTPCLSQAPLTPLISCSESPPTLPRASLRWLRAHWAWSLRPQNWACGGQKRPSPAPASSSKSHRSCKEMGCQNVRGYPPCLCHTPRQPLPAPGPAGSMPSAAAQWAAPGLRDRPGPLAPGEARLGQAHRGPVPSEAMPCLPHLPKCSPELAQACRASEQMLVQSQDLLGAAREP